MEDISLDISLALINAFNIAKWRYPREPMLLSMLPRNVTGFSVQQSSTSPGSVQTGILDARGPGTCILFLRFLATGLVVLLGFCYRKSLGLCF